MKIVKDITINEIIIKKSKFISTLKGVNSNEEANNYLKEIKKKYYDATHNCYAYLIGDNFEIQKQSDDGEPSKTAGFPILDVLKNNEITNTICIVTRYFGGIKLGTGGLVKAYQSSCIEVIKKASFVKKALVENWIVITPYEYLGVMEQYLRCNTNIIKIDYTNNIYFYVSFLKDYLINFKESIINLTKGKGIADFINYSTSYIDI